jgi:hypothetical protein
MTTALAEVRAALALLKIALIAAGVLFVIAAIAMHSGHGS